MVDCSPVFLLSRGIADRQRSVALDWLAQAERPQSLLAYRGIYKIEMRVKAFGPVDVSGLERFFFERAWLLRQLR